MRVSRKKKEIMIMFPNKSLKRWKQRSQDLSQGDIQISKDLGMATHPILWSERPNSSPLSQQSMTKKKEKTVSEKDSLRKSSVVKVRTR